MNQRTKNQKLSATRRDAFLSLSLLAALLFLPLPQNRRLTFLTWSCPFLYLTKLPCPFCGVTRSLICCAHEQWSAAWQYHLLGPPLFGLLLVSSTRFFVQAVTRREIIPLTEKMNRRLWWTLTGFLIVAWLLRLTGFWPLPQ